MGNVSFFANGRKRNLIHRAKGGPWHIRFQHEGKDILRSLGTTIGHVAKEKAKQLIEGVATGAIAQKLKFGKNLPASLQAHAKNFQRLLRVGEPAIYLLLSRGKVQYVGQAICLLNRLARHPHLLACDEIVYLPADINDLDQLETDLIKALRPPLNRRGVKRRRRSLQNAVTKGW